MKLLALALVLLAAPTFATDANTQAYWRFDGNAVDSVGSNNLTENGTIAYPEIPCVLQGAQNADLTAGSAYFSGTGGSFDSMAGDTSWTIEGYLYLNSLTSDPFPFEIFVRRANM